MYLLVTSVTFSVQLLWVSLCVVAKSVTAGDGGALAGSVRLVNPLSILLRCYLDDDNRPMEVHVNTLILLAAKEPDAPKFDLGSAITNLTALAAAAVALVFIVIGLQTAWRNRKDGDVSGSWSVLMVVLICSVIMAIGVGGFAMGYGEAFLHVFEAVTSRKDS
jgi:hypothetical protein